MDAEVHLPPNLHVADVKICSVQSRSAALSAHPTLHRITSSPAAFTPYLFVWKPDSRDFRSNYMKHRTDHGPFVSRPSSIMK